MASLGQREDGGKNKKEQKNLSVGCGGIKTPELIKPCREI